MVVGQRYFLEPDAIASVVGGGGPSTNIMIKYRNKTLPPVNLSIGNNMTMTFKGDIVEWLMINQGVAAIYYGLLSASLNGVFWWEKAPAGHLAGNYSVSIAAGANINLDTFSVPVSQNGVIEYVTVSLVNNTAAALNADFFVRLLYSQNGGSLVPIWTVRLPLGSVAGSVINKKYGPKFMLTNDTYTLNVVNNSSAASSLELDWGVYAYSWVDY